MPAYLVTEADLVRARTDPQFRQEVLAESLETLLAALKRAQRGDLGPDTAKQMKEGATLAVQLADRLQRLGIVPGPKAA
jgi:hypothetical protein